jgi:hypothetical protein
MSKFAVFKLNMHKRINYAINGNEETNGIMEETDPDSASASHGGNGCRQQSVMKTRECEVLPKQSSFWVKILLSEKSLRLLSSHGFLLSKHIIKPWKQNDTLTREAALESKQAILLARPRFDSPFFLSILWALHMTMRVGREIRKAGRDMFFVKDIPASPCQMFIRYAYSLF